MSSSNSETDYAIEIADVVKTYDLTGSMAFSLPELFGFNRKKRGPVIQKQALDHITLNVKRGERIGIVGRNGAGKTTLLKLLTGNYAPTSGTVKVNGTIQALMTMGSGFHQDYSGMENIRSSLHYSGLGSSQIKLAVEDIVEFCELGPYIDQPFKTYSMGMQARLMFACATAIHPDILIVDEVLGAGDAYFIAKSKLRMEKLVSNGCTMLLVSHSMSQILEMCDRAIWIDNGKIRQEGACFDVIKSYEGFMFAPIQEMIKRDGAADGEEAETAPMIVEEETASARPDSPFHALSMAGNEMRDKMQDPAFIPHTDPCSYELVPNDDFAEMNLVAPGGLSRWEGTQRLSLVGFSIASARGINDKLTSLQPATFSIFVRAEEDGVFPCRCGLAFHTMQGRAIVRCFSRLETLELRKNDVHRINLTFNPLQIGPGTYTLGVSVHGDGLLEEVNTAERYDLLSRSFVVDVELPDSLNAISADFFHSSEWNWQPAVRSGQSSG
ncbi:ABC transporter ATP-binding protein [Hoeflea sp. YIM 152468]|uniref:ABC transporter ATP-binding protein n=1 Tax=Hoeflea sp. YIM 152468 TaxID=3031759 RepID=UPI0023DA1AB4|nr:ABC transporter ATP-binding protein [Hoeflea sp. YIM 152468]MDF1610271.1 ABC transporter ATP-binding protein [Hoeflea sp. YIM 152468]